MPFANFPVNDFLTGTFRGDRLASRANCAPILRTLYLPHRRQRKTGSRAEASPARRPGTGAAVRN